MNSLTDRYRDAVPMDIFVALLAEFYKESGELEFWGERRYEDEARPGEYHLILRSLDTGELRHIVLSVEPSSPHRIAGLAFEPAE